VAVIDDLRKLLSAAVEGIEARCDIFQKLQSEKIRQNASPIKSAQILRIVSSAATRSGLSTNLNILFYHVCSFV
jgi:hypothetical protein